MNWASQLWLLMWIPVGLLAAVVVGMGWLHHRRLKAAFGELLFEQVLPTSVRVRRGISAVSVVLGLFLVVVALAEPRFDKQIRTVRASGVDLVLVLDLSHSMDAKDVEPSRLERARREITDLFRVLQGDRVGLVVFAGGAWPRLPLTEDLAAVELVLDEADTSTFDAQGSALGDAIRAGVDLVTRSDNGAGRALLVLSDGEIHEGDDALGAAQAAADAGVTIYAMGIGEEPAPIPVKNGWLEWNGEKVLTTPNPELLQEVARTTGGAYVKSVASPKDVVGLYEGEMRRKLKSVTRDAAQREVWRSAYQWPLGVGLLLLLGAAWLGDGRRALGAAAAALLAVLAFSGEAVAADLDQADELYRSGRYSEAADQLTELSLRDPKNRGLYDRLGAARYRAGDFEGAARAWDTAAELSGGTDTKSLYNAGNAHWRAGRLEEAADRFSDVLGQQPLHPEAQQNAEILAKELEARRNQPPPPPPQPQPEPSDDEQDDGSGEEEQEPSDGGEGQDNPQNSGGDAPPEDQPDSEDQQGEGTGSPEQLEGDEGSEQGENQIPQGPSDQMGEDTEITAGQAERMLDSVEEGSQRIRVRGNEGNKPW